MQKALAEHFAEFGPRDWEDVRQAGEGLFDDPLLRPATEFPCARARGPSHEHGRFDRILSPPGWEVGIVREEKAQFRKRATAAPVQLLPKWLLENQDDADDRPKRGSAEGLELRGWKFGVEGDAGCVAWKQKRNRQRDDS